MDYSPKFLTEKIAEKPRNQSVSAGSAAETSAFLSEKDALRFAKRRASFFETKGIVFLRAARAIFESGALRF